MKPDLPQRARMLFDRYKAFPEAGKQGAFFLVREDAWCAFLDWRQMQENEVLPALDELARRQGSEE